MLTVTLRYKDREYKVIDELGRLGEFGSFIWEEGNYSCDCNRSKFIREVDPDFPDMSCGDEHVAMKLN